MPRIMTITCKPAVSHAEMLNIVCAAGYDQPEPVAEKQSSRVAGKSWRVYALSKTSGGGALIVRVEPGQTMAWTTATDAKEWCRKNKWQGFRSAV